MMFDGLMNSTVFNVYVAQIKAFLNTIAARQMTTLIKPSKKQSILSQNLRFKTIFAPAYM